jgi:tetratricopeptide (TPR) repeat protein
LSDFDTREGEFKKAAARLRKAHKIMPGHPQLALQLAQSYYWMGEKDKAREILGKVISQPFEVRELPVLVESNRAVAHYYLGRCDEDDKNLQAALTHYEKCIELDGDFGEGLLRAGGVMMELGRWEAAERVCRKAVDVAPECAAAHSSLGSAHLGQGRFDDAVQCYRKALELEPEYTDAALNLAGALSRRKEFDEAERIYRGIIDREPQCAAAYHNLGCVCSEKGQYEKAVELHRKALKLGMMDGVVHMALGEALKKLGQDRESHEEADIAALRQAANENSASAEAWGRLAEALHRSGHYVEALQSYETHLTRNPHSAWGFRGLGDCYRDIGSSTAAQAAYRQADALEARGKPAGLSPEGVLIQQESSAGC